jgi:prepilin-type N-terminal cleavage/methylation domain-containing protein
MRGVFRTTSARTRALARRVNEAQGGFTLIEVVVATLVLAMGVIGTVALFTSSKNSSLVAQRHEVAIAQAHKEMEALRKKTYAQLGLTSAPSTTNRLQSDPDKLGYYTSGSTTDTSSFTVRSGSPGVTERLVLLDSEAAGSVDPNPTTFNTGAITGKVYRYVTWRPESCGTNTSGQPLCPGNRQTKRLIVAVTIDPNGRTSLSKPVWVGTVVTDRQSVPYQ